MHGNRSPTGRGGGRASASLPLLDDVTTSPASRRLASARPALAPKCQVILARTLRAPTGGAPTGFRRQLRHCERGRFLVFSRTPLPPICAWPSGGAGPVPALAPSL